MDTSNFKFLILKRLLKTITIFYFIWIILSGSIEYAYMIWNVILAWVPLEIVLLIDRINSKIHKKDWLKIVIIFLWILWLLFYPNSSYIITDFIHLPNEYHIINPNYSPYSNEARIIFNDDIEIWLDFINIGIGVWIGYVVGFISLYISQHSFASKHNNIISWIFVSMVHILTGFAIYIGRFNRWNSWDVIFNPANIITILRSSFNSKAIKFTFLFGIFSFTLYIISYILVEIAKERR